MVCRGPFYLLEKHVTRVRALKKLGRYHPGDEFERSRTDANLLATMGLVEIVEAVVEAPVAGEEADVKNTYSDRSMTARKPRPSKKTSKPAPKKSSYRRRDMRAE